MTSDGTDPSQSTLKAIAKSSPCDAILDTPNDAPNRSADCTAVGLHFGVSRITHCMLNPSLNSLAANDLVDVASQ